MNDSLAPYRRKRNFDLTPEPEGAVQSSTGALQYVIQKHWASRLHYDLRLEIDGAMKSWAVPKGPSFDPADKRMAVQVEDHPLDYNTFEGHIPAQQYGAGKVIVWDRGYWVPIGDAAQGYRQGKLKFELHGHKLVGRWTLVRMQHTASNKQPAWLLIKEHDRHERPADQYDVVVEMPDSVSALPPVEPPSPPSARSARVARIGGAPAGVKASLPEALAPQLATLAQAPPTDAAQWLWELKFDGYRVLARVHDGAVQLFTRNGHDWTHRMPQIAHAVAQLPLKSGWLDGEVVALGANGQPDFQALQNALDGGHATPLVYYVFDVPYHEGRDVRTAPLLDRRALLRALLVGASDEHLRLSEAFEVNPRDLVASACRMGLEGVVGKRKTATYASGRNTEWIKLKCSQRQEFVIGGFTDPQGRRTGLGALMLGVHNGDGVLRYVGNVGTGFNEQTLQDLHAQLVAREVPDSPFAPMASLAGKAHWVTPDLVAEVSFAEWTQQGRIRHPVFRGLRVDKPAKAVVRELPSELRGAQSGDAMAGSAVRNASRGRSTLKTSTASATVESDTLLGGLQVSHPDRVVDASTGLTKMDLVRHYARVAPLMMEHMAHRPVALVRAPDGVQGELFFQKHLAHTDMEGVHLLDPSLDPGHAPLLAVVQPQGLRAAAQMNVVEFHTWNARKDRIDRPDRMTFDLDPGEGVAWTTVQEAAQLLQVLLHELALPAFLKTSGGKGLHVVVPIKRLHTWEAVKGFSQVLVQHLAETIPDRFVAKSGPRNRVGKIFVDYLRNGRGATTVCAWSARVRPGMGVSVPVDWSELGLLTGGAHWTVVTVQDPLQTGNAAWDGYASAAVTLTPAMQHMGFGVEPSG